MNNHENKPDTATAAGDEINFDEWKELFERDPDAFEARRQRFIQAAIERAPETFQRRLNGLQFQIDMERERSQSPLQGCMRISSLMWEKFDHLRTVLNDVGKTDDVEEAHRIVAQEVANSADVLEFTPR